MNKFNELKNRVDCNNYNIIAVTEVKPKKQRFAINPAELALPDYDMFHNIPEVSGRGIIIYIHKSLKATQLLSIESKCQEYVLT